MGLLHRTMIATTLKPEKGLAYNRFVNIAFRPLLFSLMLVLLAACEQPADSLQQLSAATANPIPIQTATATPLPTPTPAPSPTPTPVPTATATSIPTSNSVLGQDASDIIESSLSVMQEIESFHFEMEAKLSMDSGGTPMELPISFVGDYQAPDRTRGKIIISLGFISLEMETVTIGDKAYTTNPQTGEWEVTPGSAMGLPGPTDIAGLTDNSSVEGVSVIGETTLNGTQVLHLQGKPPKDLFGDAEGDINTELWIGLEDSLIRQIKIEGDIPLDSLDIAPFGAPLGEGLSGGTATILLTVTFSNYNEPIEIEAPIP